MENRFLLLILILILLPEIRIQSKIKIKRGFHLQLQYTSGGLRLSWSALLDDFYLESTTNLDAASPWTSNAVPPVLLDHEHTVTIPPSHTRQFYRLGR